MANEIKNDNTGKEPEFHEGNLDTLYEKPVLTKKDKLKNNIHYYKNTLIFGGVAILLLVVLFCQSLGKADPDLYVIYAGRYYLDGDSYESIYNTLTSLMDEDYNEDGRVYIQLINQVVKTYSQAEKEQAESDEYLYSGDIAEGMQSFRTEIMAGESIICFIDEELYNDVANEGRLAKLSDVLGQIPENAKDEYGIYLKDTPFANACPEFKKLGDNTIVCIKKRIVTADEDEYMNHIEAFKKLFSYKTANSVNTESSTAQTTAGTAPVTAAAENG